MRSTGKSAVKTAAGRNRNGHGRMKIVTYPRPSVEEVKQRTTSFVSKLASRGVISTAIARQWRANIVRDIELNGV